MAIARYENSTLPNPASLPLAQTAGPAAIESGIRDMGSIASDIVERQDRAARMRDIAFATNQTAQDRLYVNGLYEEAKLAAPPDGAGVTAGVLKALDAREQQSLAAAPSDQARQFLQSHYAELRSQLGVEAQTWEAQQRGLWTGQQMEDAADASAVYLASNPGAFNRVNAEFNASVNALGASQGWDPAKTEHLQKKFGERLATAALNAAMETDPMTTLQAVAEGRFDAYFQNPEAKLQIIRGSLARYSELQNQAYTEQQRALKKVQDDTAKAGDDLVQAGGMTTTWLHQNRNNLDPADYRHFEESLNKGPVESNREVYADLRFRASQGLDITSDATAAFKSRQLTLENFNTLMSAGDASLPTPFKQGMDYIKQKLQPTFGVADSSFKADRMASALDDASNWYRDHPNATAKEWQDYYTGLGDRYAMINSREIVLSLGLPRFAVGGREDLDIAATVKATQDALEKKLIDPAEAEAEGKLIGRWERALEAIEQSQGTTSKGAK